MSKYVIKLRDRYLEWSTVTGSPTTFGMTRVEMAQYLFQKGTEELTQEIREQIARADKYGTSADPPASVERVILCNRTGENEEGRSPDEIYAKYCPPAPPGRADAPEYTETGEMLLERLLWQGLLGAGAYHVLVEAMRRGALVPVVAPSVAEALAQERELQSQLDQVVYVDDGKVGPESR